METNVNDAITVGTDPIVISVEKDNANGKRVHAIYMNVSTGGQIISLAIDGEAKASQGIVLNVGGHIEFSVDGALAPTQKQITAVSSAAGGSLSRYERVI